MKTNMPPSNLTTVEVCLYFFKQLNSIALPYLMASCAVMLFGYFAHTPVFAWMVALYVMALCFVGHKTYSDLSDPKHPYFDTRNS